MEKTGETSGVPKMETRPVVFGKQNGGTASTTTPAFYVLVKQSTGKSDQGGCVSDQVDCGLASSASASVKSKVKPYLPADCMSGSVTVKLDNNNMWNEFYHRSTEMILTKQGRRMFPYCRYWIRGLQSNLKYILVMDISPVDNFRYKWNGHSWEPSGKAEPHVLGRVFIHPESPSTGYYWMHQPVSFYKLKLTNNTLDQEGHIILHSMHRYLPRLHLVPAHKATDVIQLNGPDVHTFTFPQTEFFAVTAYQNIQITQLKIDYNPFAKGFREDGLSSRFQRDAKQNSSSEQEESSVTNSPSNHRHPSEGDTFNLEQRSLDSSLNGICNTDTERESLSPYHDLLGFMETDMPDDPLLKQEASESPVDFSCRSISQAESPLSSNGDASVIKEEPVDDYSYEPNKVMEDVTVKQEDADNMAEEYSSSGESILEQKLKKHRKKRGKENEIKPRKRPQTSQLGVAKAKMLKSDTGKLPVVYLEPCAVTRNTITVSEVSQPMLSLSKSEKSANHLISNFFENSALHSSSVTTETVERPTGKQTSESNMLQKCSLVKKIQRENTEMCSSVATTNGLSSCNLKSITYSGPFWSKAISGGKKTNTLKKHISHKSVTGVQNVELSGPRKRGRPRKIKHPGVGRPPKYSGKPIVTRTYPSLGLESTHLDIKPDLVDVDGVLFVSFGSKEALNIHTVDRCEEKELPNTQTSLVPPGDQCSDQDNVKIQKLEKELLEDLKSFKYKQVIHPSLQEVGLKLNFVDPTMSIDLKYLGVQLPLSYSDDYTLWKNLGTGSCSVDAGLPFISRTGKTNDFTKIKGWQGKLHSSKNEGIVLEGSLKNRSAFCSDKLDEYLENEGKLLETSMGLPSTSSCPVVYQLPTKSTSYVRTLDSVLKKQSTVTTSSCYTFKPLSMPSVSKKKRGKVKNKKEAISKGKQKSLSKPGVTLSVVSKQKRILSVLEEKVTKSQTINQGSNDVGASVVPSTEENLQGKHIAVRQTQQLPQQSRLPCLSKTQLKLMDLEDCALWDGKPRTYITEERANLSLTALLTAQASLKNKPIHKIIKRRAPPCNNDFCRLGCVCSSLALEKYQPTHCRKTDCMFGCTCLKRKVVLVKGGSKHKKMLKKPQHGREKLHCGKKLEQEEILEKEKEQDKLKVKDKKKKKKKAEYTICDTEPEKPIKNFPLWVKEDGEMDPEPVYIPTASTPEATKPVMPPVLEVLFDNKPAATDIKLLTNGVKSPRVYIPRTTPVKIQEDEKDPIYLYFESMMTCARVRMYDRKTQEKEQHEKCLSDNENSVEKQPLLNVTGAPASRTSWKIFQEPFADADCNSEPQSIKIEEGKEPGDKTRAEEDKEPEEKNWWFSCSAEDPSTSYVHHTTPGGRTKLIDIVSECNWEEDRNEILNILSQHINNKMPKSLKVGNFTIDLEPESKTLDENTAIHSSRVKISMVPCQNKSDTAQISGLEAPNDRLLSCNMTEENNLLTPDMLREQRKKGLPFYAGLSPAGKLIAYTCKPDLNPSCLIQVNGRSYPQAKLLLGQMGALHPSNLLAANLTGRLRPAMLDFSTFSTAIPKVASSGKYTSSEPKSTEVPTPKASKSTFTNNTSNSTVTGSNVRVRAQRQIAARPLADGVTSQLVVSAVGALQQKIPGLRMPQPLTGPQIFNIKSAPLSLGANVVNTTAAITMPSLPISIPGLSLCNKATCSSGIAIVNAVGKPENSTSASTTTAAAVNITKSAGITAPVATIAFAKSVEGTSTSGSSASLCTIIPVTESTVTATTPPSTIVCGSPGPSGILLSSQKPGTRSPPSLPPGAEKRMGPRLLLIPVNPGCPTLRPPQSMHLGQGKRMILQPIRTPGGTNLYRHPNGQIIQLVPLHQLQPTSPQPSSPTVMFRNPGSIVGIRLPGASKPSETPICQSSTVSSAIPTTTTPVLPVTPSPALTSTEVTTALSGALATSVSSVSPSTPCKEVPLLSLPPAVEASSSLSVSPSVSTPLLTVPPSATPVFPNAKNPSVSPADTPLVLPLPSPAVSASSVTDTPSTSPKTVATEDSSVLSVFYATEASLKLATPSAAPAPPISEATSVSPTHPIVNSTPEAIRSAPQLPASASQAVSVMPPVFVPVSQAGTLTLRISPSGIRSLNSDYKITCSKSEQPDSKDNVISLHSGSFALLQFPEQNNVTSSIVKQAVSLQVKNNEISTMKAEEKTTCSQMAKEVESEENKLSESHSKEAACERSKRAEKDTEMLEQISNNVPILKSVVASLDSSCIFEKQKCERKEVMVKNNHPVESPEESPDVTPERCSQSAGLADCTIKQQTVTPLKISEGEQIHSDDTNSPPHDSVKNEPVLVDMEERIMFEQSQKPVNKYNVNMNSTEGLPKEIKPLSSFENQLPDSLEGNVKEKKDSITEKGKEEEITEKLKVASRRPPSAQGGKHGDSAQEGLSERNTSCQKNCNTSSHKNGTAHIQKEQAIKNKVVEISRTESKTASLSVASENKASIGTGDFLEKLAKCIRQSEQKTGHLRKDPPLIIDITTDDTEKEEKTDDSADEIMDELSGYQSEDIVNIETMDESQSSEAEETVDVETVEELSEKINIARLKATAAHTQLSKQLHLVCDPSNKMTPKTSKETEFPVKKPKNAEETFSNYRQTHTANERRRRKEMRGLFEKLKATLGLDNLPKVSKSFILKQAFEEIQGLTDQADKLTGQKKLLIRKQDTLVRKVSALSGKTQEVVLKKLEYIYAKQKAVEAQKKKHQEDPLKIVETPETATETARPPVEKTPSSLIKEIKPVISDRRTKPLILSRKGSHILGNTPMALTNASLVMTTDGQVLAFRSPLVPGQVASLPSTRLQTEPMPENDNSNRTVQQGITSLMIQFPSSGVPVQVKSILPTSTIPVPLSAVANSSASPVVEAAPELSSENEDSFMMPRIVNVTSLATKEATNFNLDVNKNTYVNLHGDSQTFQPSFLSQETTNLQSKVKSQASGTDRNATGTAQHFHEKGDGIPQMVNVSILKGSSASFATERAIEDLVESQTTAKLMDKKSDGQKSKDSSFQKLQRAKDSGLEMELQKVTAAIHEPSLDTNDLMDIEENDDTDETLTSLLNEIAFLNQQLNDDASDISELPSFSLGGTENQRESTTTGSSPFQFGTVGGKFKDLSVVRGNSDSITPLLLHLDDDDLPDGNRNSEELLSESDSLKIMLSSEVRDQNLDLLAINSDGNKKTVVSLSKPRSVSPPILQMKTNLETSKTDVAWRPMPKLAPLGLKAANLSSDSEGQNTRAMPSLAHVPSKEIKTAQPVPSPSQDPKSRLTLALIAKKSK